MWVLSISESDWLLKVGHFWDKAKTHQLSHYDSHFSLLVNICTCTDMKIRGTSKDRILTFDLFGDFDLARFEYVETVPYGPLTDDVTTRGVEVLWERGGGGGWKWWTLQSITIFSFLSCHSQTDIKCLMRLLFTIWHSTCPSNAPWRQMDFSLLNANGMIGKQWVIDAQISCATVSQGLLHWHREIQNPFRGSLGHTVIHNHFNCIYPTHSPAYIQKRRDKPIV